MITSVKAAVAAGILAAAAPAAAQTTPTGTRPRLVVAIAVDQLRADYMDRFRPFFGPSGFNLFLKQGRASLPHATSTRPRAPARATP